MSPQPRDPSTGPVTAPRVTIGVPVYNGERYLERTLESLLAQTFGDFELIISDNGSTDSTPEICGRFAAADDRVRYVRSDVNRGAAWNHNRLVELARGAYFKWAAADDVCGPDFLARCVDALDGDPDAVLALPRVVEIDEHDEVIGPWTAPYRLDDADPVRRFGTLLSKGYECYHVYGVIRTEALRGTAMIGGYTESDMVTLAELCLRGRFLDLDGDLFLHRLHDERSVTAIPDRYARTEWFDPSRGRRVVFPTFRFALEYHRALDRAPLEGRDRRRARAEIARWMNRYRRSFLRDVKTAVRQLRPPTG